MLVLVIITQEDGEGRGKEGLVLWKGYSSHATGLEEGAFCSRKRGENPWGLLSPIWVSGHFSTNFQTSHTPKAETLKEVLCLVRLERSGSQYVFPGRLKFSLHPRPIFWFLVFKDVSKFVTLKQFLHPPNLLFTFTQRSQRAWSLNDMIISILKRWNWIETWRIQGTWPYSPINTINVFQLPLRNSSSRIKS